MILRYTLPFAFMAFMAGLLPLKALSPHARDEIGRASIEYMKANPDAFMEVMEAMQVHAMKEREQEQTQNVLAHSDHLFQSGGLIPLLGNPNGTLEVVVFMDPFCHFCRKFETTLTEAVKANKNLKVIARDIAIMHEKSMMLVKALLAANKQNQYAAMQTKIHTVKPDVTEEVLYEFARDLGMNIEMFQKDMNDNAIEAQVKDNMTLANNISIEATPSYIIKGRGRVHSGYVSSADFLDILKAE